MGTIHQYDYNSHGHETANESLCRHHIAATAVYLEEILVALETCLEINGAHVWAEQLQHPSKAAGFLSSLSLSLSLTRPDSRIPY